MDYLFPLNTVTVVASGAAVIAKTLVRNIFHQQSGVGKTMCVTSVSARDTIKTRRRSSLSVHSKLRSELLYDEAFSVMKSFVRRRPFPKRTPRSAL